MQDLSSSSPEKQTGFTHRDRLDGASGITDVETLRALLVEARQERDEANHRIANSLQRAISLLRAQRRRIAADDFEYVLLTTEMRLTAIAQLHQRLGAGENARTLGLDLFLAEFCQDLKLMLNIICDLRCDPVMVDGYTASQIAIIVNELAMNAIKHAYDGHEGERLAIRCTRDGSMLRCRIADHGKGLPEDFDVSASSSGLGMSIVVRAAEQLGGTLTAHNDGGAVFLLEVPLPQTG